MEGKKGAADKPHPRHRRYRMAPEIKLIQDRVSEIDVTVGVLRANSQAGILWQFSVDYERERQTGGICWHLDPERRKRFELTPRRIRELRKMTLRILVYTRIAIILQGFPAVCVVMNPPLQNERFLLVPTVSLEALGSLEWLIEDLGDDPKYDPCELAIDLYRLGAEGGRIKRLKER